MNTDDLNKECPVCGSGKIEREKKETSVCVPYGTEKKVSETLFKCSECKTTFGDDMSSDEVIRAALELSKREAVKNILSYFSDNRTNFAGMERALDLPQRTMSRWKVEGSVDAAALALLRMIRTFPWLINVADNKYDRNISDTICLNYIADVFLTLRKREVSQSGVAIHNDDGKTVVIGYAVFPGNKENIHNIQKIQSSETIETKVDL